VEPEVIGNSKEFRDPVEGQTADIGIEEGEVDRAVARVQEPSLEAHFNTGPDRKPSWLVLDRLAEVAAPLAQSVQLGG
jgi:hypothetical protein